MGSSGALECALAFSDQRLEALHDTLGFFKKLAHHEAEHSQHLQQLVKAAEKRGEHFNRPADEGEEMRAVSGVLAAAVAETTEKARQHALSAVRLNSDVVAPLSSELMRFDRARKGLSFEGQRELKALQDTHAAVRASQEAYHAANKAAEDEAAKLEKLVNTPRAKVGHCLPLIAAD